MRPSHPRGSPWRRCGGGGPQPRPGHLRALCFSSCCVSVSLSVSLSPDSYTCHHNHFLSPVPCTRRETPHTGLRAPLLRALLSRGASAEHTHPLRNEHLGARRTTGFLLFNKKLLNVFKRLNLWGFQTNTRRVPQTMFV